MANGVITWNGVASDTLGIVVSKVPSLNRPQRKYNSYSVPGRNGDIVVMQDAYADYEQEYEIFALDGAQIDARAIVDWLYQDGWCELSDDWEPEYYRMAYFVGPVDIEPIMDEAAVCTITFRCKPKRYYAHGINQMPKLRAISTRTENGVTVTVDNNGVATISGTAGSGGTVINLPFESSFTFTQDMVRYATRIYLKNTIVSDNAYINFKNNQSLTIVSCLLRVKNGSQIVPNDAVGQTIPRIELVVPENTFVRGTIKPEVKTLRPTIYVNSGDTINNPTNYTALPIITLSGAGGGTGPRSLMDLEKSVYATNRTGNTMNNSHGRLNEVLTTWTWIEEFPRGGAYSYSLIGSNSTTGSVSFTNSTGTITMRPVSPAIGICKAYAVDANADYTITCDTTSGNSSLKIIFIEKEGYGYLYNPQTVTQSGAGTISYTFHTPDYAGYIFVGFFRDDGTNGSFSNIMLNIGSTAQPFRPYAAAATETLTVGNLTMEILTSGFDTAVIDCERENITVEGSNYNLYTNLIDQHGNQSGEYLRLADGDNTVTYSSGITGCTINPRLWVL